MSKWYALTGIISPMTTPFGKDEMLDEGAVRREAQFLLSTGIHGISIGGSTGEGSLVSDDELVRCLSIVREENSRKVPVLCGVIRNSTRDAIRTGLAAKAAGADYLMITPTFYHGTDEDGNIDFFKRISQEVGLPIIIYNVIKGNPITSSTMERLAEMEGIAGIKQSVGGIHALAEMVSRCGGKTLVFGAQDDVMFLSYALGADGAISAILTLFPELCVKQWDMMKAEDYSGAKKIHNRLFPVWRAIDNGMAFPGMIKAALRLIGRDVGSARHPILPASGECLSKLKTALHQNGFIKS